MIKKNINIRITLLRMIAVAYWLATTLHLIDGVYIKNVKIKVIRQVQVYYNFSNLGILEHVTVNEQGKST